MVNKNFYANEARCPKCGQWMLVDTPAQRFTPCRRCDPDRGNLGFVTEKIVLAEDELLEDP